MLQGGGVSQALLPYHRLLAPSQGQGHNKGERIPGVSAVSRAVSIGNNPTQDVTTASKVTTNLDGLAQQQNDATRQPKWGVTHFNATQPGVQHNSSPKAWPAAAGCTASKTCSHPARGANWYCCSCTSSWVGCASDGFESGQVWSARLSGSTMRA
jgi:hypothetical protein